MRGTGVHLEFLDHRVAERALGQHALDRLLQRPVYEEASRRAVLAFYHPLKDGGVARTFPDGGLAFEEYTTVEPSLVLNGMLFALLVDLIRKRG